jgi:HPt (histidine-containing phosphotransfer) domain-containing protein
MMGKERSTQIFCVLEALERVGEDKEFLVELIEGFIESLPEVLDALDSSVDEKEPQQLLSKAHSLKGSLLNLGAQASADVAYQLEIVADLKELTHASVLMSKLKVELNTFQNEFNEWRSSLT